MSVVCVENEQRILGMCRWAESELNMMWHLFNDLAHYCGLKHAAPQQQSL